MTDSSYSDIATALQPLGLVARGGFHTGDEDGLGPIRTVVLVGNAGRDMWPVFDATRPTDSDPLDHWVRDRLAPTAERLNAELVMPNDGPPYRPFQRWAMRAAPVHPSPLGLLIDPEFGLWHALRAALLFTRAIDLPPTAALPSPCASCTGRPCLSACPVNAFTDSGFDALRCCTHVASEDGADCRLGGCRARRACPVGTDHRYADAQQAFHMNAFLGPLGRRRD